MSATDVEPISEQQAKDLLNAVRVFRREWASFAVQSDSIFKAFREKGDSFPPPFLSQYQSLVESKAALSEEITQAVKGIDSDQWNAPSPNDSLEEFEHKLDGLIRVARELARIVSEKRDRVLKVLHEIKSLRSADSEVDKLLAGLRRDADTEISSLTVRASRLADIEFGNKVESLSSLLDLTQDARNRRSGSQSQTTILSPTECQAKFEAVSSRFGITLAIEALRTGLAINADPVVEQIQGSQPSIATAVTSYAARQPVSNSPVLPATAIVSPVPEHNDRPTKEALASLVNTFSQKTSPAPQIRKPAQSVPAIEPNPVSLSTLADAGKSLKIKAHGLYPNVLDVAQLDVHPSPVKNRALGLACLSEMIEVVGYIFSERERNRNFLGKNLQEILQLLAEVLNVVRVEAEQAGKQSISEQTTAFLWLKHTCSEDGEAIHIDRYMRIEDRANPSNNAELARRVLRLAKQISLHREAEKGFIQLKRLCQQLEPGGAAASMGMDQPLWSQVNECVTQLIASGLKTSDTRLREILLPIIDDFPETIFDEDGTILTAGVEISTEFQQVINSIFDFITSQPCPVPEIPEHDPEAVVKVSELLRNQKLVIVGGIRKPHAANRLKQKLKLRDVRWLEATKSDRVSEFRTDLNGAAVVVLITRLIGHKHNEIREMCRDVDIPWVQTPFNAGYHPNTVASEILRQAGGRLKPAPA